MKPLIPAVGLIAAAIICSAGYSVAQECSVEQQASYNSCVFDAVHTCDTVPSSCHEPYYLLQDITGAMNEICCCKYPAMEKATRGEFKSCRAKSLDGFKKLKGAGGLLLQYGTDAYRKVKLFGYNDCPEFCDM